MSFPKDRLLPKLIVSIAYVLEILQVALSTRDAFRNFGSRWGNVVELDKVGWQWFSVVVLEVVRKSDIHGFSPYILKHLEQLLRCHKFSMHGGSGSSAAGSGYLSSSSRSVSILSSRFISTELISAHDVSNRSRYLYFRDH